MKERGKRNNVKIIMTLLIISVLLSSGFTALAQSPQHILNKKDTTHMTSAEQFDEPPTTYELLLEENFTDGNIPPKGIWGDWQLLQTNPNQTWYIDSTMPYTKPYCGTIHRDGSPYLQDEWLLTPSLNFSKYTNVYLTFHWYTSYYVTIYKRYVEFNISVSTDGGGNWTKIWSFNDVGNFFVDWTWQDTIIPNNNPIDLSAYAGEKDVKIGFQYYSNTTTSADYQEFSIDDINVYAPTVSTLSCDAGGPYEWWWPMQYEYLVNPGVRFHGSMKNGNALTQWLWDFGDGNTSIMPYYPIHFYADIGTFNVTLTVIDNTTTPPRIAFSETTVTLFLIKPPEIDIEAQSLSLGVKANIVNDGEYNASFVNWTMQVSWGPFQIFQIFDKDIGNGTVENIEAGTSATIRSKYYFFAFGLINIVVTAYPENIPGIIKHIRGIKIGPLVLTLPQR
ncbi:MAG: hypothetical protein JW840_05110 [Candidatus Thermoplasmatota archaeon]|nr:hypothetical protein [Candidatus Thermoplasmatota archaeon]